MILRVCLLGALLATGAGAAPAGWIRSVRSGSLGVQLDARRELLLEEENIGAREYVE